MTTELCKRHLPMERFEPRKRFCSGGPQPQPQPLKRKRVAAEQQQQPESERMFSESYVRRLLADRDNIIDAHVQQEKDKDNLITALVKRDKNRMKQLRELDTQRLQQIRELMQQREVQLREITALRKRNEELQQILDYRHLPYIQ